MRALVLDARGLALLVAEHDPRLVKQLKGHHLVLHEAARELGGVPEVLQLRLNLQAALQTPVRAENKSRQGKR